MNATASRELVETNKPIATAALISELKARIKEYAERGWFRVEVGDIVTKYSSAIIQDAYASLRTEGYTVNVMNHIVNW